MGTLARFALSISGAVALLAGCGALPLGSSKGQVDTPAIGRRSASTPSFKVLHEFVGKANGPSHEGANPDAGLLDVDGTLYGTTYDGGHGIHYFGFGTVFSLSTSGVYKELYRFGGFKRVGLAENPNSDLIDVRGTLYGTTEGEYGTVYRVTTAGAGKVLHTFFYTSEPGTPTGLINVKGTLYGTAGPGFTGIFYSLSTSGAYKVLYKFRGANYGDGYGPDGTLLNVNGTLYGVADTGGALTKNCYASGCGTVYSVTTSGKEKVLYSFQGGTDGLEPSSGLIDVNGTLYGTTYSGGGSGCYHHYGCGTVYSITTSGSEKVLYRFSGGPDGRNPIASLTEMNGTLYGTAPRGGSGGYGTVFSISPSGGEQTVHSFGGSDGAYPAGDLIAVNNVLYGTTYEGGRQSECGGKGCGTVFALTP